MCVHLEYLHKIFTVYPPKLSYSNVNLGKYFCSKCPTNQPRSHEKINEVFHILSSRIRLIERVLIKYVWWENIFFINLQHLSLFVIFVILRSVFVARKWLELKNMPSMVQNHIEYYSAHTHTQCTSIAGNKHFTPLSSKLLLPKTNR